MIGLYWIQVGSSMVVLNIKPCDHALDIYILNLFLQEVLTLERYGRNYVICLSFPFLMEIENKPLLYA